MSDVYCLCGIFPARLIKSTHHHDSIDVQSSVYRREITAIFGFNFPKALRFGKESISKAVWVPILKSVGNARFAILC